MHKQKHCQLCQLKNYSVRVLHFLIFLKAVTGQNLRTFTVFTENMMDDQDKCNSTTWIFSRSPAIKAVQLVRFGQIDKNDKDKSDRPRVSENCSLVVKSQSGQ